MDKKQAVQLLDVITDYYNDKLSKNVEILFEMDDITLYTAEIKQELMKAPELVFKNAGIQVKKEENNGWQYTRSSILCVYYVRKYNQ